MSTDPEKLSPTSAMRPGSSPQHHHVHYDVEAAAATTSSDESRAPTGHATGRRHSTMSDPDGYEPNFLRSRSRSQTMKSQRAADAYAAKINWHPGQEPGLDPSKPYGGRDNAPTLHTNCDITVVDFSEDDMMLHHLNNETLPSFLDRHGERESWSKCRWINVNGLSWDVIQELGKWKKLHSLALEDLIHTTNRTKADWYSDHVYIVLTLLKLVHMHPKDEADLSDSESEVSSRKSKKKRRTPGFLRKLMNEKVSASSQPSNMSDPYITNGKIVGHTSNVSDTPLQKMRSLQRYNRSPNEERSLFMERRSALRSKDLSVCAEQVSIFLTSDNTVISFFESSAEDIENPILLRLRTQDTILRHSCDASMILQAIVDAIVDLAIPVTIAYQDALGDLELDVLTSPEISHATRLYILTSEISLAQNIVTPIQGLISSLRDHKKYISGPETKSGGVNLSAQASAYFGDVDDHVAIISHSLDQMVNTTNSLIDLIFNTIAAYQNESVKQLTIITIIFLPLSFITGYFGMNFVYFNSIKNHESYFWYIAIPVAVVTTLFLMREPMGRWLMKTIQRRGISRSRRGRMSKEQTKAQQDFARNVLR